MSDITTPRKLAMATPLMQDEAELIWQQIHGDHVIASGIAARRYCCWWPRGSYPRRLSRRLARLGMGPQSIG